MSFCSEFVLYIWNQVIAKMLGSIAAAVSEMSKDNPSADLVEEKTKEFLSSLQVTHFNVTAAQCSPY